MVDAEWIASFSVCLVIIFGTIIYLRRKSLERQEAEERARKEKRDAAVAVSLMGGTGGKSLTLSRDEIQRDLDRLCLLFSQAAEPPVRRSLRNPQGSPCRSPQATCGSSEAPRSTRPHGHPAAQPRCSSLPEEAPKSAPKRLTGTLRSEQRARPEGPRKGSEHIQSEIEQAVKETQ